MKKPVPDPPLTTHTPFCSCKGTHPPLFAVCAGVDLEHALMHLSRVLDAALDSNLQACDLADKRIQSLTWATQQSLEIGQALIASILNGLEPGSRM